MKKTVIFLVVILLSASAFSQIRPLQRGQSSRVYTQGNQYQNVQTQARTYQQPNQQVVSRNNTFASIDEARRAYSSNNFTYYQPSDLRSYSNNQVDGVTKINLSLEQDAIVKMVVVGGIKYAIIPNGSLCRFYRDANGCVASSPYAFDMCGNAIYEFEYAVPRNQQVANQSNLNNYSERPLYQQQYAQPANFNYNCNDCPPSIKRKGWTTTQKLLALVGTAAISYAIYSISTKKNNTTATNTGNGNNNGDQTVITGGASYVPKGHTVGLSFGVGF